MGTIPGEKQLENKVKGKHARPELFVLKQDYDKLEKRVRDLENQENHRQRLEIMQTINNKVRSFKLPFRVQIVRVK